MKEDPYVTNNVCDVVPYHGQNRRDSRDDFHDKVRCQTCYLTYTTTIVQLLQDNDRKTQKKKRSLTRHSGILCLSRSGRVPFSRVACWRRNGTNSSPPPPPWIGVISAHPAGHNAQMERVQ